MGSAERFYKKSAQRCRMSLFDSVLRMTTLAMLETPGDAKPSRSNIANAAILTVEVHSYCIANASPTPHCTRAPLFPDITQAQYTRTAQSLPMLQETTSIKRIGMHLARARLTELSPRQPQTATAGDPPASPTAQLWQIGRLC